MHMITLTEKAYNNFYKKYSKKNYKQTVEYANVMQEFNYKKIYLGLIDDNDNVIAATLILEEKNALKFKFGYAPSGFLLDFDNTELVQIFSTELKKYLINLNYSYLRFKPNIPFKILDKNDKVLKNNYNIINNLKKLGFISLNTSNKTSRLEAIIEIDNDLNSIYNNFNRNIKRKIKECNLMGITFYQENDINKFYNLIEKKKSKSIDYYEKLLRYFNNKECKFNIYFAKLNTEIYLNNYRYFLKQEQDRNYKLQEKISNLVIKKTTKLLDKKISSDKSLNKYKNKVLEASDLFLKFPEGLTIATCAVIEFGDTVYFIEEGYNEKFRNIYSLSMLKWEIIKKYNMLGYSKFNLGAIPEKTNKYSGLYNSKIGFNPNIYEYSEELDFPVNKYIYKIIKKIFQKK